MWAGNPVFARTDGNTASWPAIIEKAYAQERGGWGTKPGITQGRSNEAIDTTPDAFKGGGGKCDRPYQNHAFVTTDVDGDDETVSVLNPWDPSADPLVLHFFAVVDPDGRPGVG